jgi:hypothetical protein
MKTKYFVVHITAAYNHTVQRPMIKNVKVSLSTGRGGPLGCETSRLPHFLDNQLTDGGEVVSLTWQLLFTQGRFLVLISIRG